MAICILLLSNVAYFSFCTTDSEVADQRPEDEKRAINHNIFRMASVICNLNIMI